MLDPKVCCTPSTYMHHRILQKAGPPQPEVSLLSDQWITDDTPGDWGGCDEALSQ